MKKNLLLSLIGLFIGSLGAQSTALHFDGVDDYVKISGNSDLSGPKEITLESWIYVDNFNSSPCGNCAPVIWHQGGSYRFGTGNANGLHFDLSDGSNVQSLNIYGSILKQDVWYHIAATFDGRWMRVYVDGKIQDSLQTKFSSIGYTANNYDVWIGDPQTGYGGILEETRIWNYARTRKEILEGMKQSYNKLKKGLVLQYSYEDGVPYKNNTKVSTVADKSSLGNTGSIANFYLDDSTSNFVIGRAYCDSTVYGKDTVRSCETYRLPSGLRTVNKSGDYSDTIVSYLGCDSVVSINVTILKSSSKRLSILACDSAQSIANKGTWYKKSGTYQEKIKNAVGCDSILILDITITRPSERTFKYSSCGFAVLQGSKRTVTESGTYIDTFKAWGGCDSLIKHEVVILKNSSAKRKLDLCAFVVCPTDNNVIYKKEGTYYDTIKNKAGCDSFITYEVVSVKTTGKVAITACNSFKAPSGSRTWTQSGVYRDTLYGANSKACDSFVEIDLTIIKPQTAQTSVTACGSYTSPGGKRVTTSGKIFETYKSAQGCDSIVQTIDVTIVSIDTKITRDWNTLISASKGVSGASFQWLDCKQNMQKIEGETSAEFASSGNGEYAVEITQGKCVDTSRCTVFAFTNASQFDKNDLKVFPNPNKGDFTVELNNSVSYAHISIMDIQGKIVFEKVFENQQKVDIHINASAGMYQMRVETEHGTSVKTLNITK